VPYQEPSGRRRSAVGYCASFSGGMASDDSARYSRFSAVLTRTYCISQYYRTQYINIRDKNKANRNDSSKDKGLFPFKIICSHLHFEALSSDYYLIN
jgi:hypothetical protein